MRLSVYPTTFRRFLLSFLNFEFKSRCEEYKHYFDRFFFLDFRESIFCNALDGLYASMEKIEFIHKKRTCKAGFHQSLSNHSKPTPPLILNRMHLNRCWNNKSMKKKTIQSWQLFYFHQDINLLKKIYAILRFQVRKYENRGQPRGSMQKTYF